MSRPKRRRKPTYRDIVRDCKRRKETWKDSLLSRSRSRKPRRVAGSSPAPSIEQAIGFALVDYLGVAS